MQDTLDTKLSKQLCKPLPPIRELALTQQQKAEMQPFVSKDVGGTYSLLTLCKHSKTLAIGNFVIGAKGSRHSKSSLVLVDCSGVIHLAEIDGVYMYGWFFNPKIVVCLRTVTSVQVVVW